MTDAKNLVAVSRELKPCPNPWCESHNYEDGGPKVPDDLWGYGGTNSLRVGCHYCDMKGPARSSESEAVIAWNERAPDASSLLGALIHIEEYWNRDQNESAMTDALWHIIETATEAIAAWRTRASAPSGEGEEMARLRSAAEQALNFIENTEGEIGDTLSCGDALRSALSIRGGKSG
jgi:hypothetical protein